MKLKTMLAGLAAVAICSASTLSAQVMKVVTITMTTYTQNTNHDIGTVTVFANPLVKTYTTQAILNLLAQDKLAQGQWGAGIFPAGSKLALTNDTWLVLTSANDPLVDVSDILSSSGGGTAIESGKQSNATQLAAPSLQTMEVVNIRFDDTAIAGGNQLAFYLQGLSTKIVTDTTPTSLGVYTETQTNKVTGAAGEGTLKGTPFVCSGNVVAGGKATLGKTNLTTSFAPDSLAGYMATVTAAGKPTVYVSWGQTTWGQWGTATDGNADNYCAGTYTYVKTGPNTAYMTSTDTGMLSGWSQTGSRTIDIVFTSRTAATMVGQKRSGPFSGNLTFSQVPNRAPATLDSTLVQSYFPNGTPSLKLAFSSNGTVTVTPAKSTTIPGNYTFTQWSPTVGILQLSTTDSRYPNAAQYVELIFTSTNAGRIFFSWYEDPAYGANADDTGLLTFKVQ